MVACERVSRLDRTVLMTVIVGQAISRARYSTIAIAAFTNQNAATQKNRVAVTSRSPTHSNGSLNRATDWPT